MAREVQVLAWCDVDMAEDRRVPMTATHEVVVDGKAFTVDLCEEHEAAVYKPFVALVAHGSAPVPKGAQSRVQRAPRPLAVSGGGVKLGRPLSDPAKALPLGVVCLQPECGRRFDGRTQGALTQHMRQAHGFALDHLGGTCPVCGAVKNPGNGMSTHVSDAHPDMAPEAFRGVLAAWWWASVNGDPHGVIRASGLLAFTPEQDPPPLAPGATRVQVHTP